MLPEGERPSRAPAVAVSATETAAARRKQILALALPIIGGMASQNVLNLVDTAMVGVLGDNALAAVGLGGMVNFLLSAAILGLSAGVQAMAARRVGQNKLSESGVPLNGGLVLAVAVGVPWSAVLYFLVPLFFPFLVEDGAVVDEGVPYLRARLVAMAALGINFCFRGHWNATGRAKLYLGTLVVMHVTNIVGNFILIYGNLGAPALGATGAGIATSIATWVGTLTYFALAAKHARGTGYLTKRPDRETLRGLLRLSVPNGLQQLFFAGGMVAFHVITGHVGTAELAASNVIINLLLVGILPGMGFGLAAMSFVGQALGRGDPEEARRWGSDVARLAFLTVLAISVPGLVAPELLLSIFIHDGETRALASPALRMVFLFMPVDAAGMVFMHCLLGAGDSRRVFITATVFQWLVFLPLAALVGPILMWGLTAIYATNVLYRVIQTIVFAARWRGPTWTKIEV